MRYYCRTGPFKANNSKMSHQTLIEMPPTTWQLIPKLSTLAPSLIIFDKDGTLIDFHSMWGAWVVELARRLETTTGLTMAKQLFQAMDFDVDSGRIAPQGKLAVVPLAGLRGLIIDVLGEFDLSSEAIEAAMAAAWHSPDPIALARPCADLTALFSTLRACGLKIAIATSDDRASTEATLAGLKLTSLVDALVCADDGLPLKPAPDMVLSLCRSLDISPAKTVVVGDNADDLQMGRAAGAGLAIGVLSGVSIATELAAYADLLLTSVGELVQDSG
jgi:HAD superfamily hydrolase (TIGR01549 family)